MRIRQISVFDHGFWHLIVLFRSDCRKLGPYATSSFQLSRYKWTAYRIGKYIASLIFSDMKRIIPWNFSSNTVRMRSRASSILLAIANLLIPVAVLIFAKGFFPYKPFLPGLAKFQELRYGDPPEAPFDKVIFMVVDALRRSGFP